MSKALEIAMVTITACPRLVPGCDCGAVRCGGMPRHADDTNDEGRANAFADLMVNAGLRLVDGVCHEPCGFCGKTRLCNVSRIVGPPGHHRYVPTCEECAHC